MILPRGRFMNEMITLYRTSELELWIDDETSHMIFCERTLIVNLPELISIETEPSRLSTIIRLLGDTQS
jgi:hypothetical protein